MREMNLLPEEHLYEKEQKRKKRLFTGIVATILLLMALSYLGGYYIDYKMRKDIISTKNKIENLEKIKDIQLEISANQNVLSFRKNALEVVESKRVDYYEFLSQFEKTLPKEISIDTLSHPKGDYFNISATTSNPSKIADFMANLAKMDKVENVSLDNVKYNLGEDNKKTDTSFNIYFSYVGEVEEVEKEGGNSDGIDQ